MVLFLNFVIAIMTSTFAYYESKKLGLFYEVIVGTFNTLDYDDRYGYAVCAQPPFNILLLPLIPFIFNPQSDEELKKLNE
jgi:hypothetical protein